MNPLLADAEHCHLFMFFKDRKRGILGNKYAKDELLSSPFSNKSDNVFRVPTFLPLAFDNAIYNQFLIELWMSRTTGEDILRATYLHQKYDQLKRNRFDFVSIIATLSLCFWMLAYDFQLKVELLALIPVVVLLYFVNEETTPNPSISGIRQLSRIWYKRFGLSEFIFSGLKSVSIIFAIVGFLIIPHGILWDSGQIAMGGHTILLSLQLCFLGFAKVLVHRRRVAAAMEEYAELLSTADRDFEWYIFTSVLNDEDYRPYGSDPERILETAKRIKQTIRFQR